MTKRILMTGMTILLTPALALGGLIVYSAITEYKPADVEDARILNQGNKIAFFKDQVQVTTYNIGYGGMDAGQDFFMDGGTMSRSSSKEKTIRNLAGVTDFLVTNNSDAYFIQEADENATRSFYVNQVDLLSKSLSDYSSTFAYNYKVGWVPVPWTNPMGKVDAGMMTLSKMDADTSKRYQLPGYESIPTRYGDLKRCVMENKYTLKNGKTLILLNVHLSAFDKGGVIRAQQMKWLMNYITDLNNSKDNYVIIGGDWNHLMSQEIYSRIKGEVPSWIAVLPEELKETQYKIVYDDSVNSVRSADKSYVEGENFETIIDGFLISPNIEVESIKIHDLDFKYSDHHPVTGIFRFK